MPAEPPPRPSRSPATVVAALLVSCCALLAGCSKRSVDPEEVRPVTVVGAALPVLGSVDDDPAVGTTPPTLDGMRFDGTPLTIDPSAGPTMLVFLAHWCPHCNAEVPRLLAWKASGAVPSDLDVIAITTAVDPNRDHYPPSRWIREIGWHWPVMADSADDDAAKAYGLPSYPYIVIIGADGTVKLRFSGEIAADDLARVVDQALAS